MLASADITDSVRVKAETLDQAQADYRYQVGAAVIVLGLTIIGGWLPSLLYVALVALTCVTPIVVYVRRVKQEPAH